MAETTSNGSIKIHERVQIPLATLPFQAEARGPEDDWSGLKDAAERRKIQNRLNQRLYRRRRKEKLGQPTTDNTIGADHANTSVLEQSEVVKVTSSPESVQSRSQSKFPEAWKKPTSPGDDKRPPWMRGSDKLSPAKLKKILSRDNALSTQMFVSGSPRSDQLLTLIHFNVFRALVSNTSALGFTMEWLDENAVSPFGTIPSDDHDSCPQSLKPSIIQTTVPHHPWIDLFPFPRMRDNLLLNDGYFDEYDLCNDLVDFANVTHENTGLIVWTEPWDPSGWEMSERFIEKWGWVFKGCDELMKSTNAWRVRRGEPRISFIVP